MKALVTGGAGFAGSHLTEYLLGRGAEVTVLAAEQESLANIREWLDRVHVVRADLRDATGLLKIVRDCAPDRVYHLAALSSPADSISNPMLTYEVNLLGTLHLLLACRDLAGGCRFLYVSSSEVYGAVGASDVPVREESPMRPANPYAGSKAAAELVADQFFNCYALPIVRVRPFNHTGPRQSPTFVCSDFARQVAEVELGLRAPRVSVGNLDIQRDFSDVRDIVRGYYLLLEEGSPGEIYQLGSGRPVAIREILQALLTESSQKIEVVVDSARLRPSEAVAVWGDTTKAEQAVGWRREYALTQTMRDLKFFWLRRLSNPPAMRA